MTLHIRPLPPPGQEVTLFGLSDPWADLRRKFVALIEARPVGGYRLILADWPWETRMWSSKGYGKSPERHYDTIPMDVIEALPVWKLAAPDCILLLWGTSIHLPRQLEILRLHGFEYKSMAPWFKGSASSIGDPNDETYNPTFAGGYLWRNCSEIMLIGTRGEPVLKPERRSERAAFFDPVREHSRKPDDQYRKAETLCDGPYLELFSRTDRSGWTSFGDQAGMFGGV